MTFSSEVIRHLTLTYGSAYADIVRYVQATPALRDTVAAPAPVLKAEILHAVQAEMALKLTDVVLRRTPLGMYGPLTDADLYTCARMMAADLGWDEGRINQEVTETRAALAWQDTTAWATVQG